MKIFGKDTAALWVSLAAITFAAYNLNVSLNRLAEKREEDEDEDGGEQ